MLAGPVCLHELSVSHDNLKFFDRFLQKTVLMTGRGHAHGTGQTSNRGFLNFQSARQHITFREQPPCNHTNVTQRLQANRLSLLIQEDYISQVAFA